MKKSIRNKWIKALRSGEYVQHDGKLISKNSIGDIVGHCCLGVLACVVDPTQKTWSDSSGYFGGDPTKEEGELTQAELIGGEIPAGKLAMFNDQGKSFKWIASYIERYL